LGLPDSLVALLEDGVIDTVERRLMSGKEAAVYVVTRRGEYLAAKVYKAAERRTFKATASYTEGRVQTRNSRDRRAMSKRSTYGRELSEESWRDMEYRALFNADAAGVRVPKPVLLYGDVLLMELLVDEHGEPAARLADTALDPHEAEPMFREVFRLVRLLLAAGKVHGDLSAFNILLPQGGPTIIDMPQVVDAAGNNQAREILRRDLQNVVEHLAHYDARLLRFRQCGDALWRHYQLGTLDDATQPQEGSVRGDRFGQGRREQLAERGRMGRADSEARPQHPQHRGPPRPQQPRGQQVNQGNAQRPPQHEPRRDGVGSRQGHGPRAARARRSSNNSRRRASAARARRSSNRSVARARRSRRRRDVATTVRRRRRGVATTVRRRRRVAATTVRLPRRRVAATTVRLLRPRLRRGAVTTVLRPRRVATGRTTPRCRSTSLAATADARAERRHPRSTRLSARRPRRLRRG
jgi:RIO kinase 1